MSETPASDVDHAQLGTAFAELARTLVSVSQPVDVTVPRVVELACHAIQACTHAGLCMVRAFARPEIVTATSEVIDQLCELQEEAGEGPSSDSFETSEVRRTGDFLDTTNWPAWSALVFKTTPIRSAVHIRMVLPSDHRAVFGLYADHADAFGDVDLGVAAMFGSYLQRYLHGEVVERKAADLQSALETSRVIGAAMGILMSRELMTFDQAFARLRRASQRLHRKLRDVAADVVDTGALPEA